MIYNFTLQCYWLTPYIAKELNHLFRNNKSAIADGI